MGRGCTAGNPRCHFSLPFFFNGVLPEVWSRLTQLHYMRWSWTLVPKNSVRARLQKKTFTARLGNPEPVSILGSGRFSINIENCEKCRIRCLTALCCPRTNMLLLDWQRLNIHKWSLLFCCSFIRMILCYHSSEKVRVCCCWTWLNCPWLCHRTTKTTLWAWQLWWKM